MYVASLVYDFKIQPSEAWNCTLREYFGFADYANAVIDSSQDEKTFTREDAEELTKRIKERQQRNGSNS